MASRVHDGFDNLGGGTAEAVRIMHSSSVMSSHRIVDIGMVSQRQTVVSAEGDGGIAVGVDLVMCCKI